MSEKNKKFVTQYAYAKHRACTHRAVQKAIESGRLVKSLKRDGDKLLIDKELADIEWSRNTDTSKHSNTVVRDATASDLVANAATAHSKIQAKAEAKGAVTAEPAHISEGEVEGRHISESRAVREAYLAELAKLEYLEAAGKLIDAEEARRLVFKAAREARNALKALPDTITDKLFTAPDIHTCRRILDDAVNKICAALFEAAGKATGGPPDGVGDE